jgi:3-oxoacyl-(acyl-carrier-protein) synthase
MASPIYITGAGIVSAIGLNKGEVFDSLKCRRSGIGMLHYLDTEHTEFPVGEVKLSNEEMCRMLGIDTNVPVARTSLMGMLALREALDEAKIGKDAACEIALVSGTTVGGMDMTEKHYLDFLAGTSHDEYIRIHDCGATSQAMADHFGIFSMVTTISTACSSAANAIITGANMIKEGIVDIAVVGGSECLTKFHLNGFNSLMILDREKCRPFDATRAGLNLGEGAAYIVIESQQSMQRRGVSPIAVLSGYGNACDAFHQTASSDNGEGAYLAMQEALQMAGLKPEDIDYINAHGTGTPNNDMSESNAIARVFGDKYPPVSSTKSFTGHTTSASGSIEAVICLLAIRNKFVPVNLNWKVPMENGFKPYCGDLSDVELKNVLCNSFGFGGNDSSLLFSKV